MASIRTLFLTRCRPHRPDSGAGLRNRQNICAMTKLGPVEVVSIGVDRQEATPDGIVRWTAFNNATLTAERSFPERISARLWRFRPNGHPLGRHYFHASLESWLEELLATNPFDLVVVEELPLAVYMPVLRRAGCRVVFDAHNVEGVLRTTLTASRQQAPEGRQWLSLRTLWRRLLARKLTREERLAVAGADRVWACSSEDAETLAQLYGNERAITVVPNSVDVDSYQRESASDAGQDWQNRPLTLVFPGTFSYYPNEDAALRLIREVLPLLKSQRPDVRLILLGRGPTPDMYAAALNDRAVTITGAVEDVKPFFDQPCVVTLPISLGGGTRLKILESFAASRPVVSTRKGAEGIEARDGHHLLLRESPEDIAQAVVELWESTHLRARMVSAAFELVQQKYSSQTTRHQILSSLRLTGTSAGSAEATATSAAL